MYNSFARGSYNLLEENSTKIHGLRPFGNTCSLRSMISAENYSPLDSMITFELLFTMKKCTTVLLTSLTWKDFKIMQQVRDYWKRFVAHTAGFMTSDCPFGVEWEYTSDDSTTSATEWLKRA
jgi:hypothetical protein